MPEKVPGPDLQPQSSQSRKRKQQSPSPFDLSSYQTQSTIPQLFSAPSRTCSPTPKFHQDPPRSKRSRSKSTEFLISGSLKDLKKSLTPLTEATMLNFGSLAKIIDLTDSSPTVGKSVKGKERENARPPPFQPHAGTRKLQVKNLRKPTKGDPDAYFNMTWMSLSSALTAIFNGERISASLEELYRGTENICRAERAGPLFEKLKARMNEYVGVPLKGEIIEKAGRSEEETVKAIEAAWTKWNRQLVSSTIALWI